MQIDSRGVASLSPTPQARDYDLFFERPAGPTSSNYVTFELINFSDDDVSTGQILLDRVVVDSIAPLVMTGGRQLAEYGFANYDTESWRMSQTPAPFVAPTLSVDNGHLVLTANNDNTATFGYWESPTVTLSQVSRLIRATFTVKTDQGDPAIVPGFRLRINQQNFEQHGAVKVDSTGAGGASPSATQPIDYPVYLLAPANQGLSVVLCFDMLNFTPGDAPTGVLRLDRAVLEEFDIPDF